MQLTRLQSMGIQVSSPFPIEYRRATVHVPMIDEALVCPIAHYKDVIQEVQGSERYIAETCAAKSATPKDVRPRVQFGTSALNPAVLAASSARGINNDAAHLDNSIQALPANLMSDSISDYHDPLMGFPTANQL